MWWMISITSVAPKPQCTWRNNWWVTGNSSGVPWPTFSRGGPRPGTVRRPSRCSARSGWGYLILPSASMKDIYGHPTIRSLAAALAVAAPKPAQPPVSPQIEAATPTSTREYIFCGALQALFFLTYSYVAVLAIVADYEWVSAGSSAVDIYLRLVLACSTFFLAVCAVPVAAKWVLVGRWKPQ